MAVAIARNSSPGAGQGFHERRAGPEAHGRQEQRQAERAQREVRRQRHVPGERTGPAEPAEDQRHHERTAGETERELAEARNRNRHEAQQHAERHAQADRHVRHLGGRLDRIAEVLPQRRQGLTRGDHGHAVAVLERQRGVGDAATHRRGALRRSSRRRRRATSSGRSGRRSARLARRRISRCPARCDRWRRCPDSRRPSCSRAWSSAPGSPNSSRPSPASSRICGSGSLFVRPCRTATMCTPGGRPAVTSATVVPCRSSASTISTLAGGAGAGASLGFHEPREDEDAQNGHDDADRIGHRVPDRGRAVADGIDGGLQRRRAGQRAGEQPQRVRGRHAERARPRPAPRPARTARPRRPARSTSGRRHARPAKNCRPYWMPMP